MNTLKSYISESLLDIDNVDNTDSLAEEFLKENYKISGSYTIKDGIVDIEGGITVINKKITHLTNGLFRFGKVKESFDCSRCKSLKTLEGSPEKTGWAFDCSECDLLTSLEGAPEEVEGDFYCNYCVSLKTLEGAPKKVGWCFYCNNCKSLKTLKGAPKKVEGNFYCNKCGKKFTKEEVKDICRVNQYIII